MRIPQCADTMTTLLCMLASEGLTMLKKAAILFVQVLALVGIFGFIGVLLALGV